MSENYFDQFDEKPENKKSNFFDQFDEKPKETDQAKGFLGHAQDAGVSLLKGIVSVPETAVGLADIPTGGRVGKFIEENTPVKFKQTQDALSDLYTDQYKAQQKQFNETGQNEESLAGKVIEKGKVALQNPSMIFNTVVESAPSMLAGGAIGRGLGLASKAISPIAGGAIAGGAIGEGAVMAGQQAENIRQQTDDKLLTPEQSGLSVATGALGSLFGFAGGKLAQKMGFDDINTAIAAGRVNSQHVGETIQQMSLKSIPKSIIGGAITEGLLEELPQSVSEQLLQNYALDKPLDEGLDQAIVMGTLAGMAMGGGMNTFSAPMNYLQNNRAYNEQQAQAAQEEQRLAAESQAQEQQQIAFAAAQLFGFGANPEASLNADDVYAKTGIAPNPVIDESKLLPNALSYENGIDYQPAQINSGLTSGNEVPPNADGIHYTRQQMHDTWSLAEDTQQDYGNSIEFESPESKSPNLESQIQFNDTFGQSTPVNPEPDNGNGGSYFENQKPSERLGLNPDDGPISSAAALAVDSGASSITTTEQHQAAPQDVLESTEQPTSQTARAIQHGMSEISRGMDEGTRDQVAQYLKEGNVERLTYRKDDAIQAAISNPNYNTQQNEDGSVTVVGVKTADGNWHGVSNESTAAQQSQASTIQSVPTQQSSLNTEAQEPATTTKPNFSSNHPAGTVTHAQDIANQALQQFQGDATSLEQANQSLTGKGAATDLIYYKNSPSFSNVEVVDAGDKAIVKLTNTKTGRVEEREYPQELSRFNDFLNGNQQKVENLSNIYNENNIDTISAKTESTALSSQIAQLEQQFAAAKSVPQKAKLRKQIDQLKTQQQTEAATQWQSMSPEQRQAVVRQIDVSNVPYAKRLHTAQWDNISDSIKTRLIGAMNQSTPQQQIDTSANQAATSPLNETPAPSQAQIEAGNYKKGHIRLNGLDISIENPKGSTRSGNRPDGTQWEHTMSDHYGYIKRTKGADNEHIDTYVGSNPDSDHVFIVDQLDQETGNFDEHKVMLGFDSQEDATTAYQSNFDKGWKVGPIRTMNMEQFKDWLKNEDTSKPVAESITEKQEKNNTKDYNRKTPLKPDNERRDTSPLDTTFNTLSVVSATRRVLSVLQHLKMSATQDASSRGRINVSLNNRIGVNKVGNVSSNGFGVQVISSFSDLPEAIQNDATYQDENGETKNYDVSGVWHDGTLYVVADQVYGDSETQLTTFEAYEELLVHEIIGHFGVQQLFGQEYKTKFQQLFNVLGKFEGIRKIAKDNGVNMEQFEKAYIEPYTQALKDEIYTESDVQQALVSELFAFIAQNAKSRPFVRQKLKEIIGYIRQWFRERGFDKFLSRYNDADLMMFLAEARKAVVDQSYFGKYKDQNIEIKQDSNIPQYSRNIKLTTPIEIQSDSEIGQTHFIPSHLIDSVNKLGDVVNELASMRTEGVKANVPYAIKLLRNIAQLNPNVKIHIVSDLNNIQDKAIRAGLADGGFYVPGQNTSYIYPKSDAWNSSVLELLNHELVHSVTARSISNGQVSQENLTKLQGVMELLERYIPRNTKTLSEDIKDRLYYAYNDGNFNELLAVGISESNVREALKKALGIEGLKQLDSIFTEISTNQHKGYSNEQKQSRDNQGQQGNGIKKISSPTPREAGKNINSATNVSGSQNAGRDIRDLAQDSGSVNKSSQESSDKFNQNTENDSDEPLYSRQSKSNSGSTTQQVRNVLVDRFSKETIDELERQGKLEIIQDYQVEGVEGFYYNGKAVLVASNLTNQSVIPTFLHELGGHAGFQNMMDAKQYQDLMRQFDRLVAQNNPIALEAKRLAERETDSKTQQLEYLPYLLTLASNTQIKNAIHKGNVKRLISDLISKVKAWIYDRLGANLNLDTNDMVALAERMIDKAANDSNSITDQNGNRQNSIADISVKIKDFIKSVRENRGQKRSIDILPASNTLAYEARQHGLNIDGFAHHIDYSAVNHVDANHSNAKVEQNRGNLAITNADYAAIPQVIENPDYVVYGTKNKIGRDMIAYLKQLDDGSLLYLEEVRTGKEKLALQSMRKYPPTTNATSILKSLRPTSKTASVDSISIVDRRENNQPLYSRQSLNHATDRLVQGIRDLNTRQAGYKWKDWLSVGLSTLGRRQITEIYSKILPQLKTYNDLVAQMDADKNDIAAKADKTAHEWGDLKDEEALANLMHDATLAEIDPAKPLQKGDDSVKHGILKARFNQLSPEAQAMYVQVRDAYANHYRDVRQAMKERIQRSALSSTKKTDLLKKMDAKFFGQVKGVYFPLARFGKYVVVVRDQNNAVESVSRAETMGEAEALRKELLTAYPHSKVERVILEGEFHASRDAVSRGFMSDVFDEIDNLGLSTKDRAEFEDTLNQLYLSSLPDLSWAKHGIHRKGTAGFSQNARRAFAQNMTHGATYLAKLRYSDQLSDQLDLMQTHSTDEAKKDDAYDQPTARRVIDEMIKRHDLMMNPNSHPLSSALTSLGFIYYLGLSPASAMVNLSQTALVAYPVMGAKWGFDKAATALLKASNDFRKGVKPDWNPKNWKSDISKVLSGDELKAYEEAVRRGTIDITQAHDLAGIAQGEDQWMAEKFKPMIKLASGMFHYAERFNREVTFIASYRLARQHVNKSGSKATHDQAIEQAIAATYKGHFDYASSNRARIMQGNVARVVLLFKQFGQNMVYTIARQAYLSFKGATPEEKTEARRAIGSILAMHAMFAGLLGLPMVTTLLAVASMFGGDDDEPWDAEVALRNYLAEVLGKDAALALTKGLPRAFTPVDMSGRVGLDRLILPTVQDGLEGQRWSESYLATALGPVAGIGTNVAKGLQDISQGHLGLGIESMMPTFMKSPLKAIRYADEGVQDRAGISVLDEVSGAGVAGQAIGFSPSDVRTATEGKSAIYSFDKRLKERRSSLMTQWSRAKMQDDQDKMAEVWEEIQGFNEKNPSRRINRIQLMQSYSQSMKRIDQAEDGIYLSRKHQDAREAGRFAFGE